MIELLRTLTRLALEHPDAACGGEARRALPVRGQGDWTELQQTLELHQISALVGYAIDSNQLTESVPEPVCRALRNAYRQATLTNMVLMRALVDVVEAMRRRGIDPVVWKGLLLADSFYPEPGTRWMGDVDLAIAMDERATSIEALASVGFEPVEMQPDAICYKNRIGVIFDVHHRVRLFEGKGDGSLTIEVAPRHIQLPTLRALHPTAMMALLVDHMDGHRRGSGYTLRWLLDIAFVMRRWGDAVDPAALNDLLPARRHWVLLLRTLRLLESEFALPCPPALAELTPDLEPLTLEEVLRRRRLSQWGLHMPRGWLRLAACRAGAWPLNGRTLLSLEDLLMWRRDAARERRAMRASVPS